MPPSCQCREGGFILFARHDTYIFPMLTPHR